MILICLVILINDQQKRCFQRTISGITLHRAMGNIIRFVTLTSAPGSPDDIQKSWRKLQMRIKRKYGKFEYLKVKTSEGFGVIHAVFIGPYIPFNWLQNTWKEIHGAFHVNIQMVKGGEKRLAGYFVTQYMSNQWAFERYSWSWGWVYQGFVSVWKFFVYNFDDPIALWNKHLNGENIYYDWDKVIKPPPWKGAIMTLEQTFLDEGYFEGRHKSKYYENLNSKCEWLCQD